MKFLLLLLLFSNQALALNELELVKKAEKASKAKYIYARANERGKGILPNIPLAIDLYTELSETGFLKAQYRLGMIYYDGTGVEVDLDLATKYLKMAADQGHVGAKGILGIIYIQGTKNLAQDIPLGEKLIQEAISKKDIPHFIPIRIDAY